MRHYLDLSLSLDRLDFNGIYRNISQLIGSSISQFNESFDGERQLVITTKDNPCINAS